MFAPHPLFTEIAEGADAIALIAEQIQNPAALTLKVSKQFAGVDPIIMRSAIETALGRIAMRTEFPALERGFFTAHALHQRSHPSVAKYHGRLFRGSNKVLEIGTGLGFDTIAIAHNASSVVTLEADLLTATFAAENFKLLGLNTIEVRHESFESFALQNNLAQFDGVWADPARRDSKGDRKRDPAEYAPPLAALYALRAPAYIKISPALDLIDLPPEWKKRWIGFQGECKEQLLCCDGMTIDNTVDLIEPELRWIPNDLDSEIRYPDAPPYILVEPHAALSRSGTLNGFYQTHNLIRWDDEVIYGWGKEVAVSPWYSSFEVFEAHSYDLSLLTKLVKELKWDTRTEIKKRVFPIEPESIRKKLKLLPYEDGETERGVILLTTQGKRQMMLLARRRI